jgi:hypothetical protein
LVSVSSLLTVEVDELGRPLNLKVTDETDTLASGLLSPEVQVIITEVNSSAIYWASAYDVVVSNKPVWDSGGAPELPADISGPWQNAFNYSNSTSANNDSVYSTVFVTSGTWGTGGGTYVPPDVSGNWENSFKYTNGASGNIGNTSSYVGGASGNINNTSSYVGGASGNLGNTSSYVGGASGNIGNTSSYVRSASGNLGNTSSYVGGASGNIGNTSSYVVGASGNLGNTSSYVFIGSGNIGNTSSYVGGASGNIGNTSSYVFNGSGNISNTSSYVFIGSGNISNTSSYVRNASGNIGNTSSYVGGASGNIGNTSSYVGGASGNIGNTSSYVRSASGNIGNTSSYVVGASGIITQLSASVSATVFNTSADWNTAYTHSQLTNANPHITNLSSLDGVSLDIIGLQAGQFLKYKPGFGWTNESIAITNVGVDSIPNFITNSSSINFSGTQGVSLQAVGNTLTFSLSGNVSGATSATNAFSSTYALSATSALNAQQAPNGFNVTGTLRSPVVSATNVSATGTLISYTISAYDYLNIDHTTIGSIGSNSHDDIDNHINSTSNPHSVTAEQVGNTTAQWNASALVGYPISSTLTPAAGQALMYNGSQWTASAALFAYTYGSGAPTGGSDGDIYLQTDVNSLQIPTVSATTYLNLPSGTLTWTYATSATSALNAQQAPNGFSVTGNLTTTSGDVSAIRLTDYSESKSSPSISSSSLTLDLNAAQVFTVTLNSNISTLTISNTDSRANTAQGFTLILTADGTARTITWPGSVKWPSGTGPTLTSTNNKVDILSFVSPDNGTTWYGFIGGQNY